MNNEVIGTINSGNSVTGTVSNGGNPLVTGIISNTSHEAMLVQIALLQEQMRNYVLVDSLDLGIYALKTELPDMSTITGDVSGLQGALDGKAASGHNHTLDALSNVSITTNSTGEILKWNGTAWANNTLAEAGVSAIGHTHSIGDVGGLQTAIDGKVDDSQVLTNVPVGALFTDTLTTINGKTGAITKADVVALGIPAQDTTYSVFTASASGLAPSSGTSNTTNFLRADGQWAVPPDTKYTLPVATGSILGGVKSSGDITIDANGVMSVVDDSHNHVVSNIDGLQAVLDSKASTTALTTQASAAVSTAKDYTDTAINNLISAAPGALDTLNELAIALGNDPNFATTMATNLAAKANKFVTTVGNATNTSFVITHNLNSRDLVFSIRQTGIPYAMVQTDVEFTTANTATVKFAVAPAANEYTVIFIG